MTTCRICLHTFNNLKFLTDHIAICGRCVNTLNESPELAKEAEGRLSEMLARGMRRNAERDLASIEKWKQRKAEQTLSNFDEALAIALPDWINKLLANRSNSGRDFKLIRAHRRGLLRMDGFATYPSPSVWADAAHKIRVRDGMQCVICRTNDAILDVHHIVYLSKYGTNQQSNLITLCRPCHEREHEREFDLGENENIATLPTHKTKPEPLGRLRPEPTSQPVPVHTDPKTPPKTKLSTPKNDGLKLEMQCPHCLALLKAEIRQPVGQRIRCPKCSQIFIYDTNDTRPVENQRSMPNFMSTAHIESPQNCKPELNAPITQYNGSKVSQLDSGVTIDNMSPLQPPIANEQASNKSTSKEEIFSELLVVTTLMIVFYLLIAYFLTAQ